MAFIVKRDAVVIPAGIPVASTTNLLVSLIDPIYGYDFQNIAYTKFAFPTAYYAGSNGSLDLIFDFSYTPNIWAFLTPDGNGSYDIIASNNSTNGAYIPITGWIPNSMIVTITAA